MSPKRTYIEADLNSYFDLLLHAVSVVKYSPDRMKYFNALKSQVLFDMSSTLKEETRAATDFSLSQAVQTFGLKFQEYNQRHLWSIDKEVEGKEFSTTPGIGETYILPC
jgi:hypothetical protein